MDGVMVEELGVVAEMVVGAEMVVKDTAMPIECLKTLQLLPVRRKLTIACSSLPIVHRLLARLQGGLHSIMMCLMTLTLKTVKMMRTRWMSVWVMMEINLMPTPTLTHAILNLVQLVIRW